MKVCDIPPEKEQPIKSPSDTDSKSSFKWVKGLFSKSTYSSSEGGSFQDVEFDEDNSEAENIDNSTSTIKAHLIDAIVAGIRRVSSERDRDEIIRWFLNARQILAGDAQKKDIAKDLYQSVDTKRFVKLLGNTIMTSIREYKGANLPLSLKVALPVTLVGAGVLGFKGVGVAAFGGAIGLPVVLLLFLGVAGTTSIIEAFIKDRNVRDPLTKLLLMLVAFETARRVKKEFLDALRANATVPERAECPNEDNALIEHLRQMDPTVFERHVMSFFEKDGHPVGVTQKSNDYGVDGYVLHPDGVIVVQCKRYSADNTVGRPSIQQFKGVIEEQCAIKGYFVTTSRFTQEAIESATKSSRIILIDGEELIKWHKGNLNENNR
ncbi:MAG: restriction endonuclease [Deltaproteobacteria bacterium]|nr:restriction endonuclease [Deltaproteobacteria bacterium]